MTPRDQIADNFRKINRNLAVSIWNLAIVVVIEVMVALLPKWRPSGLWPLWCAMVVWMVGCVVIVWRFRRRK